MITLQDIQTAQARIGDTIRFTPMIPVFYPPFDSKPIYAKLENTQRTGSFKDRGALNKLLLVQHSTNHRGVIAASAGNHAQALSFHGSRLGFDVTIVMPAYTPLNKITATERWGAKVCLEGESFAQALNIAQAMAKDQKLTFVHAFDDPLIIAGQGTTGLEILEQMPKLDTLIIPVGGGGLASGTALAIKENHPHCKIIGVQTESYPQVMEAFKGKQPNRKKSKLMPTIGDGVAIKNIGEVTLPLLKKYLDDIVLVSEEEMANAVLYLLESAKILAEGAGACGVAALIAGKVDVSNEDNVCAVISGGNIDVNLISRIIEKGLVKSHRLLRLNVVVPDRPGGLQALAKLLAEVRVNILQIQHDRTSDRVPLYDTGTDLTLETRGGAHIDEVLRKLAENGYKIQLRS